MLNCRSLSWVLAVCVLPGCSQSAVSTVDDAPFRKAIEEYLLANNMAMRIKEVKSGPVITEQTGSLSASMTHEKLGGPSVTWEFEFAKQPDGSWKVMQHKD